MTQVQLQAGLGEESKEIPRNRNRPRRRKRARQVGGVVLALALWEVLSSTGAINKNALPTPAATLAAMASHLGALSSALASTLEAWALGMLAAGVGGIVVGTLVGRSKTADAATETIVRMMRPLPSLALIPIAILIAGLGIKMTFGLVSFAAFWPVFINTRVGVRQVDNLALETAKVLGLKRFSLLYRVILPSASPIIASGLQVAISLALVVTVSVELVGGTGGLGQFILSAQQGNETATMFAGIVVGGIIGWALSTGFARLVDRLIPWRTRGAGGTR